MIPPGPLRAIVDQLLRDRAGVLERIAQRRALPALARVLLATLAIGAAMFGVAVGSYRGGVQLAFAALKVPLVLIATAVVCADPDRGRPRARPPGLADPQSGPALHDVARDRRAGVLLALAPVLLAARAAEVGYHQAIVLASGCAARSPPPPRSRPCGGACAAAGRAARSPRSR